MSNLSHQENGGHLRIAIVGPVYPYRAGIAYCTTRLAEELAREHDVEIVSFRRQYPKRFYPGGDDVDPTLRDGAPSAARFTLDILNPLSWWKESRRLRAAPPDVLIMVWWVWVWALPYLVLLRALGRGTRVVLQCHNVGHKEPARWKDRMTDRVLRRGDLLVVHAESEREEALRRLGSGRADRIVKLPLPVHELGTAPPSREEARRILGLEGREVALFFGHVRPFKGLDLALRAWSRIESRATLVVAGEVWWNDEQTYRRIATDLALGDRVRFDFRFIPDAEVATYFAAAGVVLAPYRAEAQSGVVLTAFHFGRPVIASRAGGMPEIVHDGDNGLLVDVEDVEGLATAVDRFFGSADRASMERAAAATAAGLSWDRYAGELLASIDAHRE